jgi:hypothetical protein
MHKTTCCSFVPTSLWSNVNQQYVRREGSSADVLPVEHGRPVCFLAKDDDSWQFAAAQNTVVVPQA